MPVKRKSRTLSEVGCELFKSVNMFAPSDKLNKMNSWTEIELTPPPSPSNQNRRASTGCLGYKNFNLKKVFMDLMTTDFDRKLEENTITMRKAAKKWQRRRHGKAPQLARSALPLFLVSNLAVSARTHRR